MSEISEIGFDSPLGAMFIRERDGAIVAAGWRKPKVERETPLLAAAKAQLDAYFFCGLRQFELPLAPAGTEFEVAADVDSIRAFRIEPLDALVLHRGTWHWGPFPIDGDEVRLFNVQGLRYAEDNRCVDLAGKGLAVDVEMP